MSTNNHHLLPPSLSESSKTSTLKHSLPYIWVLKTGFKGRFRVAMFVNFCHAISEENPMTFLLWKTSDFVVYHNNSSPVSWTRMSWTAEKEHQESRSIQESWNASLLQLGRLVILLCSDMEQHISGFFTAVKHVTPAPSHRPSSILNIILRDNHKL